MEHIRQRAGFTLIELLVALVVGMLLMATMIGLSGSVQRSFGRSKEINDLQSNLRFAMKTLVDDLARASYMQSPNPNNDYCHRISGGLAGLSPSIVWNDPNLDLTGNYVSPRDYLWNQFTNNVACRNKIDPAEPHFNDCGGYEPSLMPYADGPGVVDDIFCPGLTVRVDVGDRRFQYLQVSAVAPPNQVVIAGIDPNQVRGHYRWINPVNMVRYTIQQDATYVVPFSTPTAAASNWQLARRIQACRAGALGFGNPVILADFLLPQTAAEPGMEVSFIQDNNATLCGTPATPALGPLTQFIPNTGASPDPVMARSMLVVLRGRTSSEDPQLYINNYAGDLSTAQRYGIDLDSDPANGLAHVREIRTMVELRNLGLNQNI